MIGVGHLPDLIPHTEGDPDPAKLMIGKLHEHLARMERLNADLTVHVTRLRELAGDHAPMLRELREVTIFGTHLLSEIAAVKLELRLGKMLGLVREQPAPPAPSPPLVSDDGLFATAKRYRDGETYEPPHDGRWLAAHDNTFEPEKAD